MNFRKRKNREEKTVLSTAKSKKRIDQEKQVEAWKRKLEKIAIPSLETKLLDLEQKINEHVMCEFDLGIQEIEDAVGRLPIKERLLFQFQMGYKFSNSNEIFRNFFAEGRYKNYPEMSYVETQSEVGLSFTVNKECLLYCAIYGDQLTQIPVNMEHPYYTHLKNANIKYRGLVFDEYFSNLLLTGKNISLKDPYVLKDIIKCSDIRCLSSFIGNSVFYGENMGQIYKRIGYIETAEIYRDIKGMMEKKNLQYVKENLDEILPENNINIIDVYYGRYIKECQNFKSMK